MVRKKIKELREQRQGEEGEGKKGLTTPASRRCKRIAARIDCKPPSLKGGWRCPYKTKYTTVRHFYTYYASDALYCTGRLSLSCAFFFSFLFFSLLSCFLAFFPSCLVLYGIYKWDIRIPQVVFILLRRVYKIACSSESRAIVGID